MQSYVDYTERGMLQSLEHHGFLSWRRFSLVDQFSIGEQLSSNINQVVKKFVIIDDEKESNFFISLYIIDESCGGQHFPSMKWAYKKGIPPIHVYCVDLWDTKYK